MPWLEKLIGEKADEQFGYPDFKVVAEAEFKPITFRLGSMIFRRVGTLYPCEIPLNQQFPKFSLGQLQSEILTGIVETDVRDH